MFLKYISLSVLVFFLFMFSALAADNNSGTLYEIIGITNDYAPRGVTQSDEQPAIHGELYYLHKSGLYVNTGATTISYDYDDSAFAEVDLFAGIKKSFAGLNFDLSARGYLYPGTKRATGYDFYETKFSIGKTFDFSTITAAIQYSPDYWLNSGKGLYKTLAFDAPIKNGFSLIGEIAHQSVEDNKSFTVPDYWHWSTGIALSYKKSYFMIEYMDSSFHKDEIADGAEPRLLLTTLYTF